MKLFTSVFVSCALVTAALALHCFNCWSTDGICTDVCTVKPNQQCVTEVTTSKAADGTIMKLYSKFCDICLGNYSMRNGTVTHLSLCCNGEKCNGKPFTENTTLNDLQCFGFSSEANVTEPHIVKCVGIQDRCLHGFDKDKFSGSSMVIKGCASRNICESKDILKNWFPERKCCKKNLCNNVVALAGSEGNLGLSLLLAVVGGTLL